MLLQQSPADVSEVVADGLGHELFLVGFQELNLENLELGMVKLKDHETFLPEVLGEFIPFHLVVVHFALQAAFSKRST